MSARHIVHYAVQVALATDCLRLPRTSEETIMSMEVIAARDTASRALAGLGKRRGGGDGSPSPVGKERAEESKGRHVSEHGCDPVMKCEHNF